MEGPVQRENQPQAGAAPRTAAPLCPVPVPALPSLGFASAQVRESRQLEFTDTEQSSSSLRVFENTAPQTNKQTTKQKAFSWYLLGNQR